MKNHELFAKAHSFLSALKKRDKVAVIHHTDADGVCSGVLAARAVENFREKKVDFSFCQNDGETSITKETVKILREKGINKVVITDLAVDETPATIRALEEFADILIIDHHLKQKNLSSEKTTIIKAEDVSDIEPSQYPATKLTYDIFFEILGERPAWIAAVGIIGDYAGKTWTDFIESVEKSGVQLKDLKDAEALIAYARAAAGTEGVQKAFEVFYPAINVKDVLKSELSEYKQDVEKELHYHIAEHIDKAMFVDDIILYEFESKYNIKSRLSNRLSQEIYPNKTVLVLQKGKERVDISARRQDMKKSMAYLVRSAVSGIPKSLGGGHTPAAGGYFPIKYLEKVKKKLIS